VNTPAKILVVDDTPKNVKLLADLLSVKGYAATTAASGREALAQLPVQKPDLILLDVVMPEMSGYEVCSKIREDAATRMLPVIMVTALDPAIERVKGIEAGADDFLSKPIFPEELFARVKSLIKLKEFTDELETAETVLCTLGLSVESRDPYTEGHCERLAEHASNLGRHLLLDEDDIIALRRGGYLHDLGKIAVPDEILKKGANLTPEEWMVMKRHPVTGENICRPLKSLRLVLPIIRNHHEHFNGSGYPDGLHGRDIPLLARILQVVDVYDALRTARPYKPALSHEQAAITMRDEARTGLWDEELVAEYFSMLEKQRQVA